MGLDIVTPLIHPFGVSLTDDKCEKPPKKKFKSYAIGYFQIDIAKV